MTEHAVLQAAVREGLSPDDVKAMAWSIGLGYATPSTWATRNGATVWIVEGAGGRRVSVVVASDGELLTVLPGYVAVGIGTGCSGTSRTRPRGCRR